MDGAPAAVYAVVGAAVAHATSSARLSPEQCEKAVLDAILRASSNWRLALGPGGRDQSVIDAAAGDGDEKDDGAEEVVLDESDDHPHLAVNMRGSEEVVLGESDDHPHRAVNMRGAHLYTAVKQQLSPVRAGDTGLDTVVTRAGTVVACGADVAIGIMVDSAGSLDYGETSASSNVVEDVVEVPFAGDAPVFGKCGDGGTHGATVYKVYGSDWSDMDLSSISTSGEAQDNGSSHDDSWADSAGDTGSCSDNGEIDGLAPGAMLLGAVTRPPDDGTFAPSTTNDDTDGESDPDHDEDCRQVAIISHFQDDFEAAERDGDWERASLILVTLKGRLEGEPGPPPLGHVGSWSGR